MQQGPNVMVFKSPMSKSKINVNFFETPNPLEESSISSKMGNPYLRDGVNSRKRIMVSYNNQMALTQGARQNLLQSQKNLNKQPAQQAQQQPKPILEFNPKKYVTKDYKEQDIIQMKQVFDFYDAEQAGMLSPNDLKNLLSSNGYMPTKETLYEIFAELDEDELGGITFEYFLKAMDPEKVKMEKKDTIRRVYRKYDRQNKGYVTFEDFKKIVKNDFKDDIKEELLLEIFKKTDSDGDGKMSFEDFEKVISKKVF